MQGLSDDADLLVFKSHEKSANCVDSHWVQPSDDETRWPGIGRHGTVPFSCDDAVDDGEVLQRFLPRPAFAIEVKQGFIEIESHAPGSVIAVPVAGADHAVGVAEDRTARPFDDACPGSAGTTRQGDRFLECKYGPALKLRAQAVGRKLVSCIAGSADCEMRQTIAVTVDANHVFQA